MQKSFRLSIDKTSGKIQRMGAVESHKRLKASEKVVYRQGKMKMGYHYYSDAILLLH